MNYDSGEIYSIASEKYRFPCNINQKISMDGMGVWLSTNKEFVIDYYSGQSDKDDVLVTLEFDPKMITSGNTLDSESVITVPVVKIKNIQKIIDGNIVDFLKTKRKSKLKKN